MHNEAFLFARSQKFHFDLFVIHQEKTSEATARDEMIDTLSDNLPAIEDSGKETIARSKTEYFCWDSKI